MAIQSFRCGETRSIYECLTTIIVDQIKSVVERKLQMLDDAADLKDLRSPPGNQLEQLSGNRPGQHSIRINDQWRICFVWGENGPESV